MKIFIKKHKIQIFSFLLFIIAATILTVFGDKGLLNLYHMAKERDGIVAEERLLEKENNAIRIEIERLKKDRRYIASIARQELGMIGKDEIIYIFEE